MKHLLTIFLLLFSLNTSAQYWKQIGPGIKPAEHTGGAKMAIDEKTNTIYIGGVFDNYPKDGLGIKSLLRFNGDVYQALAANSLGHGGVEGIGMYKDTLFISGRFKSVIDTNIKSRNLAKYYNGKVYPIDFIQKDDSTKAFSEFYVLGDTLYMGGYVRELGGNLINGLLKYDGHILSSVLNGVLNKNGAPNIHEIESYANNLVVGGGFYATLSNQFSSRNLQVYNHTKWDSISQWGVKGQWGDVYALQEYQGDLYVGGAFRAVEPYLGIANHITRFDGEHFYSLGNGFNQSVFEMQVVGNELLIAGGFEHIELDADTKDTMHVSGLVRWNGKQFCHVSNHTFNDGFIQQMGIMNDTLIIAGNFTRIDNDSVIGLAKWVGDYRNFPGQCTQEVKQKIVDANLGLEESVSETVASIVYPNPVIDVLTVELKKGAEARYKIVALGGEVVVKGKIDSRLRVKDVGYRIDMSSLEPGTYVIQLETEESITIHKILKQ